VHADELAEARAKNEELEAQVAKADEALAVAEDELSQAHNRIEELETSLKNLRARTPARSRHREPSR